MTATGRLGWKSTLVVAAIAFGAMLAPVGVWTLLVPSNADIQQLRAERDQLQADVHRLRGADSVVLCGPTKTPCAPVDPTTHWTSPDGSVIYYALKP